MAAIALTMSGLTLEEASTKIEKIEQKLSVDSGNRELKVKLAAYRQCMEMLAACKVASKDMKAA